MNVDVVCCPNSYRSSVCQFHVFPIAITLTDHTTQSVRDALSPSPQARLKSSYWMPRISTSAIPVCSTKLKLFQAIATSNDDRKIETHLLARVCLYNSPASCQQGGNDANLKMGVKRHRRGNPQRLQIYPNSWSFFVPILFLVFDRLQSVHSTHLRMPAWRSHYMEEANREMLGRRQLNEHELRQLESKCRLVEKHVRVMKAALSDDEGATAFLPKETTVIQRMYLSMMETDLARIKAKLGHYAAEPVLEQSHLSNSDDQRNRPGQRGALVR